MDDGVFDCEKDPVVLAVRERLCVTDGVEEADGVSDWLGVDVILRVADGVCNCEADPVVLAVRERLFVTDGVEEAEGVSD